MNNRLVSKIIDCVLNILIVLFAIFLMISMYTFFQTKILKNEYSNFFGFSLFEVQTGSMKKSINPGDWIITKSSSDVEVGDVVTYRFNGEFITHRVIEKYKGTYVTKGDANSSKDEPIDQSQIVGKVVKTLPGFGIFRKTIFNPFVLVTLIITLYLFNLTFKPGKSKFDEFISSLLKVLKKRVYKLIDSNSKTNENKKVVFNEVKNEDVGIEFSKNVLNEVEENEKLDISDSYEEVLSQTSMFRVVSVGGIKEEPIVLNENVVKEEDLEKTSMYRIISADISDVGEKKKTSVKKDNKKEITKEIKKETKKKAATRKKDKVEVVDFKLSAEKIDIDKDPYYVISKNAILDRIKSKKAKNIIDKYFDIKKIIYDEIINVLSYNEKVFIKKSSLRNEFMEQYMYFKYYDSNYGKNYSDLKKMILDYSNELKYKYIRDEKQLNIITFYTNAYMLIASIDNKYEYEKLGKEICKIMGYNEDVVSNMSLSINNILEFSYDYLNQILEKLQTNAFDVKYNKLTGSKNLYGSVLKHNISFSKVYSDYIVDKTYSEGIVSEDKIAVLLNLVLCKVVNDLLKGDFESKYFVFIPACLYGKDKKLDKIVSIIDNEYTKNHIYLLTSLTNMLKNKDDIIRLRKKGYNFSLLFNKRLELEKDDLGYVYMAEYYFLDSSNNESTSICEIIPKDLLDKIVKDNISLKIDYDGGE